MFRTTAAKLFTVRAVQVLSKCSVQNFRPMISMCGRILDTNGASHFGVHRRCLSTTNKKMAIHQIHTFKNVKDRIMLHLCLNDKIDPEKLTFDSDLFDDMGLDSLDFVEVILFLEDDFYCEIPDGDSDRLRTPRQIYQYLCDKFDVIE